MVKLGNSVIQGMVEGAGWGSLVWRKQNREESGEG